MSDSNFNYAVTHVLQREGGYVNHRSDPGGATNYGVSLRFLLAHTLELDEAGLDFDFDNDGDIDADDIARMTVQDARDVYFRFFWDRYGYKHINGIAMALKIFDMCVNMGARQAHKLVQRACRVDGIILVDDGILGPKSFRAINECDQLQLIGATKTEQKHFYLGLIRNNSELKAFEDGWMRRAYA